MSVINDMLRDLDKRQAPEVSDSEAEMQESLIEPQSPAYKKWLLIVSLTLISLLVFWVIVFSGIFFESKPPVRPPVVGLSAVGSSTVSSSTVSSSAVNSDEKLPQQAETLPLKVKAINEPTDTSLQQTNISETELLSVPETKLASTEESLNQSSLNQSITAKNTNIVIDKETVADDPLSPLNIQQEPGVTQQARVESIKPIVVDYKETQSVNSRETEPQKAALKKVNPVSTSAEALSDQSPSSLKRIPKEVTPKPIRREVMQDKTMQVTLSLKAMDLKMADNAMTLISQGRDAQAYRELYAFIGEHEEDTESRTVLASYLLQEGRMAEVGDVLLNAPLNASPKLRQIKARWYAAQDQVKMAVYTLNSNLPKVEEYSDYYVLLAAYYQRLAWSQEASEIYALLLEYDDNVADWWAGLGLATDRNNETNKAIYAYQQALELNGLSTELFNFVQPRLAQLRALESAQIKSAQK